jgi:hypothetical protein
MLLSRQFAGPAFRCRARIGRKVWNASAFPQVTALALKPLRLVRVFEFMPLNSAPDSVQPQDIEDRVSQDIEDSQLTSPAWQPG